MATIFAAPIPTEVYDNVAPSVDDAGMPMFLSETDFSDPSQVMDPETCAHENVGEVGCGMATGRFSSGDEYVQETCLDCGLVLGGDWTGGVL